jgi:hypothetical protein
MGDATSVPRRHPLNSSDRVDREGASTAVSARIRLEVQLGFELNFTNARAASLTQSKTRFPSAAVGLAH